MKGSVLAIALGVCGFVSTLAFPPVLLGQGETRGLTVAAKDASGNYAEVRVYDKVWALVIGIDSYGSLPSLKYAVQDARGVKEELESEFQVERVESLFNEQATRAAILSKFIEMNRSMGENDGLFVFIASHGVTFSDVGFIVPYDGSDKEEESISKNIS